MVSRLPSLLLSLLLVLQATSALALLPRRVPPPRGPGFGSRGVLGTLAPSCPSRLRIRGVSAALISAFSEEVRRRPSASASCSVGWR